MNNRDERKSGTINVNDFALLAGQYLGPHYPPDFQAQKWWDIQCSETISVNTKTEDLKEAFTVTGMLYGAKLPGHGKLPWPDKFYRILQATAKLCRWKTGETRCQLKSCGGSRNLCVWHEALEQGADLGHSNTINSFEEWLDKLRKQSYYKNHRIYQGLDSSMLFAATRGEVKAYQLYQALRDAKKYEVEVMETQEEEESE